MEKQNIYILYLKTRKQETKDRDLGSGIRNWESGNREQGTENRKR